jgi:hypothetical protein
MLKINLRICIENRYCVNHPTDQVIASHKVLV